MGPLHVAETPQSPPSAPGQAEQTSPGDLSRMCTGLLVPQKSHQRPTDSCHLSAHHCRPLPGDWGAPLAWGFCAALIMHTGVPGSRRS